jgi:hypothetical protein
MNYYSANNWLKIFKKHTFPTKIIHLSKAYLDFLNEPSIYIPDEYFTNKKEYNTPLSP